MPNRRKREEDLERELQDHLALEAAERESAGLSPAQAGHAAKRALGNVALVKEDVRRVWSAARWLEDFLQDVRVALRQFRKSPGFAAVAVVSLALGIGANSAIFTLIDSVLLKQLPVRDPGGLVALGNMHATGSGLGVQRSFSLFSYDLYQHLLRGGVFSEVSGIRSSSDTAIGVRRRDWSEAQRAQFRLVSGNYFDVLGVNAALGRSLRPSDDSASAPPVAVVSFRYWQDKLASDPSVVGSTIELGGVPFAIAGVAPPGFYGETLEANPTCFWLPLSADRQLNGQRNLLDAPDVHWLYLMGRLQPNLSKAEAESRLNAALHNWLYAHEEPGDSPEDRDEIAKAHIEINSAGRGMLHLQRDYATTFRLLLGISIAVLLITCANIANLLLARGAARSAETSTRLALGAGRGRLVRQSLTESLTLAVAGGALGLVAASGGARILISLFFRGVDYVPIQTAPDRQILAFTLALSCGAALVFGLLPALRTDSQIAGVMKRGRRSSFGFGQALIAVEVALSLVVLAGAGTLARSLGNLAGQQFGFQPDRVLVAEIDASHAGYDYRRLQPLYRQMRARLNSLPGVRSASFSFYSPFNGCCSSFSISVSGVHSHAGVSVRRDVRSCFPGLF